MQKKLIKDKIEKIKRSKLLESGSIPNEGQTTSTKPSPVDNLEEVIRLTSFKFFEDSKIQTPTNYKDSEV